MPGRLSGSLLEKGWYSLNQPHENEMQIRMQISPGLPTQHPGLWGEPGRWKFCCKLIALGVTSGSGGGRPPERAEARQVMTLALTPVDTCGLRSLDCTHCLRLLSEGQERKETPLLEPRASVLQWRQTGFPGLAGWEGAQCYSGRTAGGLR